MRCVLVAICGGCVPRCGWSCPPWPIAIITVLANRGVAMAPLSLPVLGCEFAGAALFGLALDAIKTPILSRFGID
jgi:hypothetical protein